MLRLKYEPGLLNGTAVALAGLLLLEVFAPRGADVRGPRFGIAAQSGISRDSAAPQPAVSALGDILLDRPLFAPSRRPAAPAAQAQVDMPRLSGIMITPREKIAFFSPATGAPIIARQNSRIGAFTVLAISDDNVTIDGPRGVMVLGADFTARGMPPIAPATSTVLAGGVYLSVIKVALPSTLSWTGQAPAQ